VTHTYTHRYVEDVPVGACLACQLTHEFLDGGLSLVLFDRSDSHGWPSACQIAGCLQCTMCHALVMMLCAFGVMYVTNLLASLPTIFPALNTLHCCCQAWWQRQLCESQGLCHNIIFPTLPSLCWASAENRNQCALIRMLVCCTQTSNNLHESVGHGQHSKHNLYMTP
jgi:hypothetical protein